MPNYPYRFNGQSEHEEYADLHWYQTPFRPYDPQLGRFWGVDLLADDFASISPMQFAFNNPISFNDPTGLASDLPDQLLDEVTMTAGRLPFPGKFTSANIGFSFPRPDFSSLFRTTIDQPTEYRMKPMLTFNSFDEPQENKTGLPMYTPVNGQLVESDAEVLMGFLENGQGKRVSVSVGKPVVFSRARTGSNFLNVLSVISTFYGAYAGFQELSSVRNGYWLGKNGKWNALTWGGNGATGGRSIALSKSARWGLISKSTFILGAFISTYQVIENPTTNQSIQSSADIIMGGIGAYGGAPGWFISGVYFADQFATSIFPAYKRYREITNFNGRYKGSDGIYVCFAAGTLIYTEDSMKPIETLKEDEKVYSYNFDTQSLELKPIIKSFKREVDRIYHIEIGKEKISATTEHPFYVDNKGWVKVKDLKIGDRVKSSNKKPIRITSIRKENKSVIVYNIRVKDNHNYYITHSKLLVHNKDIEEGLSVSEDKED